jgi:glycosyltransferase involved in cell wall biosynthesis
LAQLKALVEDLGISNLYLMGATSDLEKEMNKASIYAMTSATECFPMVLLEAQVAGMAIISYDCPNGPRNIITANQDGWLTTPNEIEIFSERLALLIKNESDRKIMGAIAKRNVMRFSKENIMEGWNELLLKLQAEKYV